VTEIIKSIDINEGSSISARDVIHDATVNSIDVDQTSGKYAVTSPNNEDGTVGGNVIIYPQSPQLEINVPVVIKDFRQVTSLRGPYDSRFDYVRRKLWIADTGNNRVLKINIDTEDVEVITDNIVYPHAIAANLNRGGAFVKAYKRFNTHGKVYHLGKNGQERAIFEYLIVDVGNSTSSSSSQDMSSSSSSTDYLPSMPFASSIVYDHVRSRCWWVEGNSSYMVDERNLQVIVYDLMINGIEDVRSIEVEFSSGNAFIVGRSAAGDWVIIQINRDNTQALASAYIEEPA